MKSDHVTDFEFLVRQDELHHCVIEQLRGINENKIEWRKRRKHLFRVLSIESNGGNRDRARCRVASSDPRCHTWFDRDPLHGAMHRGAQRSPTRSRWQRSLWQGRPPPSTESSSLSPPDEAPGLRRAKHSNPAATVLQTPQERSTIRMRQGRFGEVDES
jgi:hypothetical protein